MNRRGRIRAGAGATRPLGAMGRLGLSMARFTWAGAVAGSDGLGSSRRAAANLDAVSFAARRQLGPWWQLLFQAGDDLQSDWLDRLPRDLRAESWWRFTQGLWRTTEASWRVLRPDIEGLAARRELVDKMMVYALVRRASTSLGADAATRDGFERAVARARRLNPRHVLWALEGMGHGHARARLDTGSRPTGLMTDSALPEGESLMVHLGLGMAFAEHCFARQEVTEPTLVEALREFAALCRDNSRVEHGDAALEALGLVLRCFVPELCAPVGQLLDVTTEPDLRRLAALYWHGVGRAVYFLPLQLMPGYASIESGLARIDTEAPDERARDEARAGFAYAATLVNLGGPVVIERLIVRSPGTWDVACREGMLSAVRMRSRVTPDDPELAAFLAYEPADRAAREGWRRHVAGPVESALRGDRSAVSAGGAVARTLAEVTELAS
ncbi:MAG: hypothetical protein AAGE94_05945 [Acidobacteriota bacterium]